MAGNGPKRTLHPARATVFLVGLLCVLVACSKDDKTAQDDPADLAAFCANAPDADEEVPADYVGSAEHVSDLRELAADAPAELRGDFDLIVRHFDDEVDPAEPESQMFENFPHEVNAALGRLIGFIDANCDA